MGKAKRMRPERLGEKLRSIRNHLDCSLSEMAGRLSNDEFSVRRTAISQYELNDNEPPLPILLRYAEIANVYLEVIVDDRIDLPESIPSRKKSEGIKRQK
jgi:transcriptional regulator with XRE-family HTH domain